MEEISAERIAAIARMVGPELSERLTLQADAMAGALARDLQLVAWDREQLVGQVQARIGELRTTRPSVRTGSPVRVIERAAQPLESIDLVWLWLSRGRRVRLEQEAHACSAAVSLFEGLASKFDPGVLEVSSGPPAPLAAGYIEGGVDPPGSRIAVIDTDADRELAAYVLARTGLRRSGLDPRGVKRAYVSGDLDRLERHLRRLWVGVNIGPAEDHHSFAGPVPPHVREPFIEAHEQWRAHPQVHTWCAGGVLSRSSDTGCYLAPALFTTPWPAPELPLVGPMMVIVTCDDLSVVRQVADEGRASGGQVVQIGGRSGWIAGPVRHVRGALLIERLPPGLPEPRPV